MSAPCAISLTRWSILPMIGNNGIPLRANMASTGRRAGRRSTALLMRSGYSRATALRHWRVTRRSWHDVMTFLSPHERSPSVRYARLMDDVRNDMTQLPQFFETAGRVLDIDQKRQKSMALVSALSPTERKNAERRMRENAAIAALTREKLTQRAASYHYALERLVIATPSPQAVDIERAVNHLQALIARYRGPAPTWMREQNLATVR